VTPYDRADLSSPADFSEPSARVAHAEEGLFADAPAHGPSSAIDDANALVLIVDDDESIRKGLASIFRSVGFSVRVFESAAAFLKAPRVNAPSCLVLDVRLPGMSGLALQAQLPRTRVHIPVVMMTGHADIPMSVRALKAGAIDFLVKPFRDQDMIDAVSGAIESDRGRRLKLRELEQAQLLYEALTRRERQIFSRVCQGMLNKQIAAEMGVSEITVKVHRRQVMQKLRARTVPDLVRMEEALKASAERHDLG
jgi:FixJ family two-component response regulator